MILIIDNYDSFTYNLVQMVSELYHKVHVIKNNTHTIEDIQQLNPSAIILSPGPCTPKEAGICVEVIKNFYDKLPILGICLGHQCIAEAFGGQIERAHHICHGKVDMIHHDFKGLYYQISDTFEATRYHSLIVSDHNLPNVLMISARSHSDQYIMGIRHIHYPVEGFQFHPESYKTKIGEVLIRNFVELVRVGGYYA